MEACQLFCYVIFGNRHRDVLRPPGQPVLSAGVATKLKTDTVSPGTLFSGPVIMAKRFTIPFVACISALIVSEYFLLEEAFSNKRFSILLASASGLILSIICFWMFYKKYRKVLK
ncbi:MAG: hypothetical protein JWP27_2826 [Flaviaesturariibacter sp.]|nr:hypothetical protein [Flaviaesturariibacter sp.]